MAAKFTLQLYVEEAHAPRGLVREAADALLASGTRLLGVRRLGSVQPEGIERAVEAAADDLQRRTRDREPAAEATLAFSLPFDLTPTQERILAGKKELDSVRTIDLGFAPSSQTGAVVPGLTYWVVSVAAWEEYVLAYGDPPLHERNFERLVHIAKDVYGSVHPFFGWADGALNAHDQSYEPFAKEGDTSGNRIVLVGPKWAGRVLRPQALERGARVEDLPDGGVLVVNPSSYGLADLFGRE